MKKKIGGSGSGWVSGWQGQGGCERRSEVIERIQKKKREVGSGGVGRTRLGRVRGGGGRGIRGDLNKELKFL